ncbi:MAG: tetratricopeptide repeat protein, partial [Candidatus Roizmanbacteria bacterium]|nr:tetratricopeptide repeat protein [Candidatus Roizmanbacteria bacterium]
KRFFNLSTTQAWISGLVVGIHPFSWFTVGTIASTPDLLATLFVLGALMYYIEKNTLLFFLLSFLAFLSKETALVLVPGLILIHEISTHRLKKVLSIKYIQSILFILVGLIVLFGIYAAFRLYAVPEGWRTLVTDLPFSLATGTRLSATARTIFALLVPFQPSISDATRVVGIFHWKALTVSLLVLTGIGMLWKKGIQSTVSRLILFMLLALAPGLNSIPLPRFWTTNYGYFATIGIGVGISLLWAWCRKKQSFLRKSIQAGIILWIITASISTAIAGLKLKDDRILFEEEVKRDVHFREGAYYLGNYHWEAGSLETAAAYYKQSLDENQTVIAYVDRTSAEINLAGVLLAQGNTDQAEELLTQVLNYVSGSNERLVRYNLAVIAHTRGDYYRVVELLDGHIANWNRQEPWLLLIKTYSELEQKEDVERVIQEAWPFLDRELKEKLTPLLQTS